MVHLESVGHWLENNARQPFGTKDPAKPNSKGPPQIRLLRSFQPVELALAGVRALFEQPQEPVVDFVAQKMWWVGSGFRHATAIPCRARYGTGVGFLLRSRGA